MKQVPFALSSTAALALMSLMAMIAAPVTAVEAPGLAQAQTRVTAVGVVEPAARTLTNDGGHKRVDAKSVGGLRRAS